MLFNAVAQGQLRLQIIAFDLARPEREPERTVSVSI